MKRVEIQMREEKKLSFLSCLMKFPFMPPHLTGQVTCSSFFVYFVKIKKKTLRTHSDEEEENVETKSYSIHFIPSFPSFPTSLVHVSSISRGHEKKRCKPRGTQKKRSCVLNGSMNPRTVKRREKKKKMTRKRGKKMSNEIRR